MTDVDLVLGTGTAHPGASYSDAAATSGFSVWNEGLDASSYPAYPAGRAHVVALPGGGYLFLRFDNSAGATIAWGSHNTPLEQYFVEGDNAHLNPEHTRRYTSTVQDGALDDADILLSYTHNGQAHVVFGVAGSRVLTTVVWEPDSWASPGKFTATLPEGIFVDEVTFHYDNRSGSVRWASDPTMEDDETLSAAVGFYEIPESVKRYRTVSGTTVYTPYDADVTATVEHVAHSTSLSYAWVTRDGEPSWEPPPGNDPEADYVLVEHMEPKWKHRDPVLFEAWGEDPTRVFEWTHFVRRVWLVGAQHKAQVVRVYFGMDGYNNEHHAAPTSVATAVAKFTHDPTEYFPIDDIGYVKFETSGWRIGFYDFWSSGSRNNSPRFYTVEPDIGNNGVIPYPVSAQRVFKPESPLTYQAFDDFNQAIIGPVVTTGPDEWGLQNMHLLVLYFTPNRDEWHPEYETLPGDAWYNYYPEGMRHKFAYDLDDDIYHDLYSQSGVVSYDTVAALARPEPTAEGRVIGPGSIAALLSLTVDKPYTLGTPGEFLTVVSSGVWPGGAEPLDVEDLLLESSDTVADAVVFVDYESGSSDNVDLSAAFEHVLDSTVVVEDVAEEVFARADLSLDGSVYLLSIGDDVDVTLTSSDFICDLVLSRDLQDDYIFEDFSAPGDAVFLDATLGMSAWYDNEDVTLVFDSELSSTVVVGAWFENVDLSLAAEHEPDAAVTVQSFYPFVDFTPSNDPQLVLSVRVLIADDYQTEDIVFDTDSLVCEVLVSVDGSSGQDDVAAAFVAEALSSVLLSSEGDSTGEPPPPGSCLSGEFTVTLPAGADPEIPLTYVVDGRLVQVWHNGVVLDTFYLLTSDLEDFCVNVVSASGDPLPELPPPDVEYETPTYMVDTSLQDTDVFMWGEGDFIGAVSRGPNVLIDADNNVEVTWDVASPDDLDGKRVVWLFGYENPPIGFEDAALIAESGNGKYLRAVLP